MSTATRPSATAIAARVGRKADRIAATDLGIREKHTLKAFRSTSNSYIGLQGRGGASRDDKGRSSA